MDLLARLQNHIAMMAPHQRDRYAGKLLVEARDEIVRLRAEDAELRRALEEIATDAHCIAKAGPLSVPTLDVAWNRFTAISGRATSALTSPSDDTYKAVSELAKRANGGDPAEPKAD